jgi:sugar (pentulose or hexulose) kinase
MKRTYFLGIDIGTYESKGVLVDADGVIQATASRPHPLSTPGRDSPSTTRMRPGGVISVT